MSATPTEFFLPFVKKEQVAENTFAFYFERQDPNWDFIPGQYNRVILPHENPDERGTARFFTIASSPLEKDFIRIITKIDAEKGSSFKKTLYNLTPGTKVKFFGPMGNFILKDEGSRYVFLIGGIATTPLLSIIPFVASKKLTTSITALISFSTSKEIVMKDYLQKFSEDNSGLKLIYTVTHPEADWNGETGRISDDLIKKYIADISKPYYYIVGPKAFNEAMITLVKEMGIAQEKIVKEEFIGY